MELVRPSVNYKTEYLEYINEVMLNNEIKKLGDAGLKENESLKVIEVSKRWEPTFSTDTSINNAVEWNRIQTRIFTDGEISSESEEILQKIDEYYIGRNKYPYDINALKTKNLCFRNHSYVITYVIAKQLMTVGNIRGWFDVVKDVIVYLENAKDRKALKNAKEAIREIEKCNKSVNYSSLFKMFLSQGKSLERFETEKVSKDVYCLRKIK